MGQTIRLTASDGHELGAYRAEPSGTPRGGALVVQEIFGVNGHIRNVCDRLAAQGYLAVAPALFDRITRDFQSGYSPQEVAAAREIAMKRDWSKIILDCEAAQANIKDAGKTVTVGFCMGGSVAFLAATRMNGIAAASCFYGGQIVQFAEETPRCPVQMHFGERDEHIPMQDVEVIRAKRTDCEVFVYPAGHGFYCDERGSFDAQSAKLAWERTLALFEKATPA
jgi:carboxymethylenebutenolidase